MPALPQGSALARATLGSWLVNAFGVLVHVSRTVYVVRMKRTSHRHRFFLQLLCLVMRGERLNDGVETAIHYDVKLM